MSVCNANSSLSTFETMQLEKQAFLTKMPVERLVELLRSDFGIKVHFEVSPVDLSKEGFTANSVIERYKSVPHESISSYERDVIEVSKILIKNNKGESIVDYSKPYILLNPSDLKDFSKLIKKIEETGIYLVHSSNGSIIIYPVKTSFKRVEKFNATFKTAADAYRALLPLLAERNLDLPWFGDQMPQISQDSITLNVKDEDFRIFITRFAEAIGSNVVWEIGGFTEIRNISFIEIKD